jgi:hypothetical protein
MLTATNYKLAKQLEASQTYIKKLKEEIADLKAKMKPAYQGHIPAKTMINDNYCWSQIIRFTRITQVQHARHIRIAA